MSSSATELVAAPRDEVWAILAEPLHLPDWWPGLLAVEPDRRGFAPGARWGATATRRNPFFGARRVETALLLRDVELYERWTWHLLVRRLDVEIRLRAVGEHQTEVTVTTSRGARRPDRGQAAAGADPDATPVKIAQPTARARLADRAPKLTRVIRSGGLLLSKPVSSIATGDRS